MAALIAIETAQSGDDPEESDAFARRREANSRQDPRYSTLIVRHKTGFYQYVYRHRNSKFDGVQQERHAGGKPWNSSARSLAMRSVESKILVKANDSNALLAPARRRA